MTGKIQDDKPFVQVCPWVNDRRHKSLGTYKESQMKLVNNMRGKGSCKPSIKYLESDTYSSSGTSHKNTKKPVIIITTGTAILTAVLSLCAATNRTPDQQAENNATTTPIIIDSDDDYDTAETVESTYTSSDEENIPVNDSVISEESDVLNDSEYTAKSTLSAEEKIKAQDMLDSLAEVGGYAWDEFDILCKQFNLSDLEMASKLTYMCESEYWGNGCITPVVLCAQMYLESSYIADEIGDGGAAVGLGQVHKCAVDDINRIFDTNYTYEDRSDPQKGLEMMILYDRICYKQTHDTGAMLAMYNAGHKDAINHEYGKNYVKNVYKQINFADY